jgi:integrase
MILRALLDRYTAARLDLSAGHLRQMGIGVNALGRWLGRVAKVADLTEGSLLGFLRAYRADHAAATTNSRRRDLLALWRFAWRKGLCTEDPARAEVPKVREPKRLPEAWTRDEVRLMVAHARGLSGAVDGVAAGLWWSSLILACWDSSARISELLSVKVQYPTLAVSYFVVQPDIQKSGQERLYWLSDETVAAIAGHWCPHRELVWPWPYSARHLWVSFRRRIVEPCGLVADPRRLSLFHKLRRSTLSAEAAESLEAARRRAGHMRAETTVRHYIDPRIGGARHLPPALSGDGRKLPCGRIKCCCNHS